MSRAESSASRRRRAATRRRALKRNYHAQATYGTNAGLWAHPYGPVAAEGLWAHDDRVGVRVPDAAAVGAPGARPDALAAPAPAAVAAPGAVPGAAKKVLEH